MHRDTQTIPCFFLHDSLMAALQEEQTFFRLNHPRPVNTLPFSIIPPLCPCPELTQPFIPEVGPLVADSGWILHPCTCVQNRSDNASNRSDYASNRHALSPGGFTLPGYPPLPHIPGFILGYAGNEANSLLKLPCPATKKLPHAPFPVKFWYRANVTIECTHNQETGTILAQWTVEEKIKESRTF